jgi:hypothetical protein
MDKTLTTPRCSASLSFVGSHPQGKYPENLIELRRSTGTSAALIVTFSYPWKCAAIVVPDWHAQAVLFLSHQLGRSPCKRRCCFRPYVSATSSSETGSWCRPCCNMCRAWLSDALASHQCRQVRRRRRGARHRRIHQGGAPPRVAPAYGRATDNQPRLADMISAVATLDKVGTVAEQSGDAHRRQEAGQGSCGEEAFNRRRQQGPEQGAREGASDDQHPRRPVGRGAGQGRGRELGCGPSCRIALRLREARGDDGLLVAIRRRGETAEHGDDLDHDRSTAWLR